MTPDRHILIFVQPALDEHLWSPANANCCNPSKDLQDRTYMIYNITLLPVPRTADAKGVWKRFLQK